MGDLPPNPREQLDRLAKPLADLEARLSPDSVPTAHPWRVAARNSCTVMLALAGAAVIPMVALRGQPEVVGPTAWRMWFAVGGLAVVVFFGHAALGLVVGRRAATNAVALALGLLSVGLVVWLVRHLGSRAG
jgi:hypothetical protein